MRLRVMAVDDEPEVLALLRDILEPLECEVFAFPDSWVAAQCVEGEAFDLVMLDFRMPRLDGLELARRVRASRWNKNSAIALLTAYGDAETVHAGFEAGVNFFLSKPFRADQIARIVSVARGSVELHRRRDHRVPFGATVKCWLDEKYFQAPSVNLGESGMLLKLPSWVPLDRDLRLEFELPASPRTICVHCLTFRRDAIGQVAVRFTDLSPRDLTRVQEFLGVDGTG